MTIHYEDKKLRLGGDAPRFMMPGDHARAEEMGFVPNKEQYFVSFVDSTVERIFNLIGRKGLDLPGIDIDFNVSGHHSAPIHYIQKIKGDFYGQKWSIGMSRSSYEFDDYLVNTAASEVKVPGHNLSIHNDGSGSYMRYIGKDWEADKDEFYKSFYSGSNSKDDFRTYIKYNFRYGEFICEAHDAAEKIKDQPIQLNELEVLLSIDQFLEQVAEDLEQYPDVEESVYQKWERLMAVEKRPIPANMPSLFVTTREEDSRDQPDVVLRGNGKRLCPLSHSYSKEHPVPP